MGGQTWPPISCLALQPRTWVCLILLLLSCRALAPPDCINSPKAKALMDFYHVFNGPHWANNNQWDLGNCDSICEPDHWYGVHCNSKKEITQLILQSNNLTGNFHEFTSWDAFDISYLILLDNHIGGSIPSQFYSNTQLTSIIMATNQLTGTLSPSISNLPLVEVDFSQNQLEGALPSEIFKLTQLKRLLLGQNSLEGSIEIPDPAQLPKQPLLEYISLQENLLTGPFPSNIFYFTNLAEIHLNGRAGEDYMGMTGTLTSNIGNLQRLTAFDIHSNQIQGELPSEISKIPNLQMFSVSNNQMTGPIPDIWAMRTLENLILGLNQFVGTIPSSIWNATSLTILDLGGNLLTGTISSLVGQLKNIQSLNFKGTSANAGNDDGLFLNGTIPDEIYSLSSLSFLFLSFNELSGTISTKIGQLTLLDTFSAETNQLEGVLPLEFYSLPKLTNVWLYSNQIGGIIHENIKYLTLLKALDLHSNQFVGFVPTYFTTALPSLPYETNWLFDNPFLCPIPDPYNNNSVQERFGADCSSSSIISVEPTHAFSGVSFQANINGQSFPFFPPDTPTYMMCILDDEKVDVSLAAENLVICNFPNIPKKNLFGPYQVTVAMTNLTSNKLVPLADVEVSFFHRPNLTDNSPTDSPNHGGGDLIVSGTGFEYGDQFYCRFGDLEPVPGSYTKSGGTCKIPPHDPGVVGVQVANDYRWSYSHNISIFVYYKWCPLEKNGGECYGENHGICMNATNPYCLCMTETFNISTVCAECDTQFWGPACYPCPNCTVGECNDGFAGDGTCSCPFFWTGEHCDVFWMIYAGPSLVSIMYIAAVIATIWKIRKWWNKVTLERLREEQKRRKTASETTPSLSTTQHYTVTDQTDDYEGSVPPLLAQDGESGNHLDLGLDDESDEHAYYADQDPNQDMEAVSLLGDSA